MTALIQLCSIIFPANAVQAMVSKDIVHRDLKPQNILLNHEGRSVKNPQPQDIKLKIGNLTRVPGQNGRDVAIWDRINNIVP